MLKPWIQNVLNALIPTVDCRTGFGADGAVRHRQHLVCGRQELHLHQWHRRQRQQAGHRQLLQLRCASWLARPPLFRDIRAAGSKNATFIASANKPAIVIYFNSGAPVPSCYFQSFWRLVRSTENQLAAAVALFVHRHTLLFVCTTRRQQRSCSRAICRQTAWLPANFGHIMASDSHCPRICTQCSDI